jgi:hypothetical protein
MDNTAHERTAYSCTQTQEHTILYYIRTSSKRSHIIGINRKSRVRMGLSRDQCEGGEPDKRNVIRKHDRKESRSLEVIKKFATVATVRVTVSDDSDGSGWWARACFLLYVGSCPGSGLG